IEEITGQEYADYLDENRLISPESQRLMLTRAVLNDGDTTGYGYGLFIGELEGHPRVAPAIPWRIRRWHG
ncbi:MAG: hypothetical protein KAJ42_03520, partial [Gemmatimonadetes bacterium]|nr:hypothetical protein [Gemmatimonadota bacterium]